MENNNIILEPVKYYLLRRGIDGLTVCDHNCVSSLKYVEDSRSHEVSDLFIRRIGRLRNRKEYNGPYNKDRVHTGLDTFDRLVDGGFEKGTITSILNVENCENRFRLNTFFSMRQFFSGHNTILFSYEKSIKVLLSYIKNIYENTRDKDELSACLIVDEPMNIDCFEHFIEYATSEFGVESVCIDNCSFLPLHKNRGGFNFSRVKSIAKRYNVAVILTSDYDRYCETEYNYDDIESSMTEEQIEYIKEYESKLSDISRYVFLCEHEDENKHINLVSQYEHKGNVSLSYNNEENLLSVHSS